MQIDFSTVGVNPNIQPETQATNTNTTSTSRTEPPPYSISTISFSRPSSDQDLGDTLPTYGEALSLPQISHSPSTEDLAVSPVRVSWAMGCVAS